jgi:hypothetical protein
MRWRRGAPRIKKRDEVLAMFADDDEKAGADIVFRCVVTQACLGV